MDYNKLKQKLENAIKEGAAFSFEEVVDPEKPDVQADYQMWVGRVEEMLKRNRSVLGTETHALARDGRAKTAQAINKGDKPSFRKGYANINRALKEAIRVLEDEYGDQLDEPPKSTRAAVPTERPSSTTSEYDLTESQKAILRLLVEHVRTDGRSGDDVWITFLTGGRTFIEDFKGDPPPFSRNVLKIFSDKKLMSYHTLPSAPDQYICTLTQKAKDAVDSDFGAAKGQRAAVQQQTEMNRQVQVFLCHASEDKDEVMTVYQRLKAEGFKPWIDKEDLLPGQDWDREIRRAIKESDCSLAFFSKNSVSKRGYYQKELKLLLEVWKEVPEGQIYIIPVRLDDECEIPDEFKHLHYVNLFEPGGFDKIVRTIQSHTAIPIQQNQTVEEKAARMKRDHQDEQERKRFLETEEGVQAAWGEAKRLYQEFARQAALIKKSGWPMHVETKRDQGPARHIDVITFWPFRLHIDWFRHFKNTLKDSSLIIMLLKQDKSERYEEKFEELRNYEYRFHILKSGEAGWQQTKGGSEFYRTKELVEMTMHDLLERLDKEKPATY